MSEEIKFSSDLNVLLIEFGNHLLKLSQHTFYFGPDMQKV